MTHTLLLSFGFLILAFVLAVYKFWVVHRRTRARARQLELRMMQETWSRSQDE